jgi:predicted TIM-barrel fold metal-dependent hydrolase
MIIDVHAHYYPDEYLQLIGRPELPPKESAPLKNVTIEERLEMMDRQGVAIQVLSVSQAQPYLETAADAAHASKVGNDLYLELCREHGNRFFSLAQMPLPHVNESILEIERVWDDKYNVGATIGCSIAGRHLDDPEFAPVYDELNRRNAVVLLHPTGTNCVVDGDDYNFNWLVGAPFEDTIAALRLAMSGITERCPNIRFIVPHLGGALPFLLARILRMTGGRGEQGLRKMYYDTVNGSVDALQCAANFWGVDRLLYGTDFPYESVSEYERRLTYIDEVGLSQKDVDQIKGERIAELLDLAKRLAS